MTYIDPGKRNRQVSLLKRKETKERQGSINVSYPLIGYAWAYFYENVKPKPEYEDKDVLFVSGDKMINIRYRTDIDEKDKVEFKGRTYSITSITEKGMNESLDITLKVEKV